MTLSFDKNINLRASGSSNPSELKGHGPILTRRECCILIVMKKNYCVMTPNLLPRGRDMPPFKSKTLLIAKGMHYFYYVQKLISFRG